MTQTMIPGVTFTATNVGKCLCTKCPVQSKSQCVSTKLSTIGDALKQKPLNREAIPGLYCSTGTATCNDINTKQSCLCGGCAVFSENKLDKCEPVDKYCRDGRAR